MRAEPPSTARAAHDSVAMRCASTPGQRLRSTVNGTSGGSESESVKFGRPA